MKPLKMAKENITKFINLSCRTNYKRFYNLLYKNYRKNSIFTNESDTVLCGFYLFMSFYHKLPLIPLNLPLATIFVLCYIKLV